MFDIHFYQKSYAMCKALLKDNNFSKKQIRTAFESYRDPNPVVYNIETTNACNMKCKMCPRTTLMDRQVSTLNKDVFTNIIDQLRPWRSDEWRSWSEFVKREYGIAETDMSENHFFLYIIPRVIQLHGYGDPLLDRNMSDYIKLLSDRGFESYFSCNPANINIEKTVEMFENGLNFIKYSIESVDDDKHREIRGDASNFSESYKNIMQLLEIKKKYGYKTVVVITMLDLNNEWQEDEYQKLKNAFKGKEVYIYLKSEDQQWYRQDFHGTNSIHWSEVCKHPWMSMTIKSNAEVAMCMEDYNNEIILGDAKADSLHRIWNGEKYSAFREQHLMNSSGIKCTNKCDMKVAGDCIG